MINDARYIWCVAVFDHQRDMGKTLCIVLRISMFVKVSLSLSFKHTKYVVLIRVHDICNTYYDTVYILWPNRLSCFMCMSLGGLANN